MVLARSTEFEVVTARVATQGGEGAVHVDAKAYGEHAFGLFDHHSAVEGRLQLFGEHFPAADGPLLEQADRGDVHECLRGLQAFRW